MAKDRAKEIEKLVKNNPDLTGKQIEELYESEDKKEKAQVFKEKMKEAEIKADKLNTQHRWFVYKKTNSDDEIVELTFVMFENFMVNQFSYEVSIICDYEELILKVRDEDSFDDELHYFSEHKKYEGYDVSTYNDIAKHYEEISKSTWNDVTSEHNLFISKTMLRFSI